VRAAYLGAGEQTERQRGRALAAGTSPLLTVRALSAGYGAAIVVRDAALEIAEGELVAVLGANGAGKTTLMRALSGLIRPVAGEVRFLGAAHRSGSRPIASPPGPDPGAGGPAGLSGTQRGRQSAARRLCAHVADEARMIEALLRRFPALKARRHQRAGLLSGGEQQMLAIARGPDGAPQGADARRAVARACPETSGSLYDLLAELREEGTTMLLVDQMAAVLALSVADRAYVLQSGTVTHSGTAREVARDPALVHAYLGNRGTGL
jgi:branched-chain amino acid transport system ATP-binding protein